MADGRLAREGMRRVNLHPGIPTQLSLPLRQVPTQHLEISHEVLLLRL
jgi:hypothetical protein